MYSPVVRELIYLSPGSVTVADVISIPDTTPYTYREFLILVIQGKQWDDIMKGKFDPPETIEKNIRKKQKIVTPLFGR